jgi:hypothetical protein
MLLIISIIAALWVKFYMKKGLFEADAIDIDSESNISNIN